MLKKLFLFILAFLLCQSIALAEIVVINNTRYASPGNRSYVFENESSGEDENGEDEGEVVEYVTSGEEDGEIGGAKGGVTGDGGTKSGDEGVNPAKGGSGSSGPSKAATSGVACNFSECDRFLSACVYTDIGTMPVQEELCACTDNGADDDISLCDSNYLTFHSILNYSGYARGLGASNVAEVQVDQSNYYYYTNPASFCPAKLIDASGLKWGALSSSGYYNYAKNIPCNEISFPLFNGNTGIGCIAPGFGSYNSELSSVNICVYDNQGQSDSDFQNQLDYQYNHLGLQKCSSKINERLSSSLRTAYNMVNENDVSDNPKSHYFLYKPDDAYAVDPTNSDFYLTECYIECGTSTSPIEGESVDFLPLCQGWYYLQDCESFRSDEQAAGYYVSDVYDEYIDPTSVNATMNKVEVCRIDENNKGSFVYCGYNGNVTSDNDCAVNGGTCSGASGEYDCAGNKYCSQCACQSSYMTLSDWCSTANIGATPCDNDHFEGVGTGCNYDSEIKYTSWRLKSDYSGNACNAESQTLAVVDYSGNTISQLYNGYGPAIEITQCYSGNTLKWQVTCDKNVYNNLCYPTASNSVYWCIHGANDETTMRSEATSGSPNKYCKTVNTLGVCEQYVVVGGSTGTSMVQPTNDIKIYKTSSVQQCHDTYGAAATAQACSSSADSSDIDGYNCYYDLREFKYSTTKDNGAKICEVRHDLSGDYIIYKGQKRWAECNCLDIYKYHGYTGYIPSPNSCGGEAVLSGKACRQDLSNVNYSAALINKWKNMGLPYDADHNTILPTSVDLYLYCTCDAKYAYTCCESDSLYNCNDSSSRVHPVNGSPYCVRDGKFYYETCQCDPDDLPDHWSYDYFGCTNGAKPTGVWKDDGCGNKMYQCSDAVVCTDEYTETCSGVGEVGDGEGCQDNTGEHIRWKKCKCDTEYSTLCNLDNQSGVGDACTVEGNNKYKACGCPESYQACVSPAVVPSGATACVIENNVEGSPFKITETVYSDCVCPSGYSECNTDGQVGDTTKQVCVSGGVRYYESCTCPDTYEDCAVATSTRPFVPGIGIYTYTGVTSTGYGVCKIPNVAWDQYKYQACKCNEERFSQCKGIGATPIGASCKTDFDEETLYTGCICGSGYTDQCLESEGKIVDPSKDYDYCQINDGEKYYQPSDCLCEANGWQVCDPSIGQYGVGTRCLIGNSSSTNPEKYASCACSSAYSHECSGAGLDETASPSCSTSSGVTTFSSCSCLPEYTESCSGNGLAPNNPTDYCDIDGTKKYNGCSCSSEYRFTCLPSEHLQPANSQDFCLEADGVTKKYKECQCDPLYNTTCNERG